MSLILGIDPGSRVTGYGIVKADDSGAKYITSGCIRTSDQSSLPEKLDEIFNGVSEIIESYSPQELAIEQVFMAKSAASALKLGQARGVAILAATQLGLVVTEYAAKKVKQAVVGTGAATKQQMQHMVRVLLNLDAAPQQDAADALAIAICHINTQQSLIKIAGADSFRRGRLGSRRT
jgi:crossover junction endodeoxyribonuclease RuvC|tara:strand:- start:19016 stop:19549 length:534 start_codon:yes stop_codon:yes gene_type:complete